MDLKTKDNDLLIDTSTLDMESENSLLIAISSEIIEYFDMQPADDIDFPEIFSRQRSSVNSDDTIDMLRRKRDAERILKSYPEIRLDSILVAIRDNSLDIQFRLISGVANATLSLSKGTA